MEWKGAQTVAGMTEADPTLDWGTEIPVAALGGFEFESESLVADAQFIESTAISGNIAQLQGSKGNELHSGDLIIPVEYNTIGKWIAHVLGAAADSSLADSAYTHSLTLAVNLTGLHPTVVFGMLGLFVRAYPSVKINSFTISCAAGEVAKATINCTPNKVIVDDSGTNALATLSNITRPTDIAYAEFNHLIVAMNDQSGGNPDYSTDAQYLNAFSLTFMNNMRTDSVTTRDAPYVDEPKRNGWLAVSGTLTYGELDAATRMTEHLAKTVKKMLIKWQSPSGTIGASSSYKIEIQLPSVQFESDDINIAGPEMAPNTVAFKCSRALSTPTGFVDGNIVSAFALRNKVSNNQLKY